ncbi:MAG: hypothetical protein WCO69_01940 [Candidatus Omnitrophota bacterium]
MVLLRRFLFIFAVFGALVIAAGWVVVNNAAAMSYLVRQAVARSLKAVDVRELRFGSLAYTFPSDWALKDVRARLVIGQQVLTFTSARLDISNALGLCSIGRGAGLSLSGADGFFDKLKVNGISGRFYLTRTDHGVSYRGDVSAGTVAWDRLGVSKVKATVSGDAGQLSLRQLQADVYGGKTAGKAMVAFGRVPRYEVSAVVEKADIGQLDRVLGGVFHELGGTLSGRVRLAGSGPQIDGLDMNWDMPSGGKVSAALLSSIATYLPASQEKKRIDSLIRSGGKLAVEVFSFTIKNDAPDHLSGEIGLKSREANLELHITHEVKVDARIDSLLQAWSAVFKQERI